MKEYKAVIYQENALSSLLFGSAKIDPVRFSAMFLFWKREAYVVILEREDA